MTEREDNPRCGEYAKQAKAKKVCKNWKMGRNYRGLPPPYFQPIFFLFL